MKIFFSFLLVLFIQNIVFPATEKQFISTDEVQESLKYIEEPLEIQQARFEIFYNNIDIPYKIDSSVYKDYFCDNHYNFKKSKTTNFRLIRYYSNGLYEWFKNFTKLRLIYDKGILVYIVEEKIYPNKILINYIYDIKGNLKYLEYINYKKNSDLKFYIFDNSKKYIGTWYKDNFYNKEGQIILKGRDFIPFN